MALHMCSVRVGGERAFRLLTLSLTFARCLFLHSYILVAFVSRWYLRSEEV